MLNEEKRFPVLAWPLKPQDRSRIGRRLATWSAKPCNGRALGEIFERLTLAFEFNLAWQALSAISRNDSMTVKFTDNFQRVGQIAGQYLQTDQIAHAYRLMDECLSNGGEVFSGVAEVSLGFARRADCLAWLPILHALCGRIDSDYLDEQIGAALGQLTDFGVSRAYPFATDEYIKGLTEIISNVVARETWLDALERRKDAAADHEAKLELIYEALDAARQLDKPSTALFEVAVSLIELDECRRLAPIFRRLTETSAGLLEVNSLECYSLSYINDEDALAALFEYILWHADEAPKTYEYSFQDMVGPVTNSALRLGMFTPLLRFTEACVRTVARRWDLPAFANGLWKSALGYKFSKFSDEEFRHCPDEFWKSYAELLAATELKPRIFSKLAVRQ